MEIKMNIKDFTKKLTNSKKIELAKGLLLEVALDTDDKNLSDISDAISIDYFI